ncbi:DUF6875 domain-containing protein [Smaragdicoccus niigatensis]|uniref:DUF6875 domain-containing protein n=1 Tax=Smaragdicoccus niigatensis TaxID=359359 RepID=UPI000379451E|nr:hypothetical protein [Smaragdicoccus niigatensis]
MDRDLPKLVRLHGQDSVELDPDFLVVRDWVESYLSQPSPLVGRSGPVCPFTTPSIERRLLWVGRVDDRHPDVEQISGVLRNLVKQFADIEPTSGRDSLLKAIILTFPNVTDYSVIDDIQRTLKPHFIKDGLMIGQFYPGCAEPGLWNPHFRPLSSPLPLIAVRQMVSSDFPFLRSTPEWIEIYLRQFAPGVPGHVRSSLARHYEAS